MTDVQLSGTGLHTGAPCSVALRKSAAAFQLLFSGGAFSLEQLEIAHADLGVTLRHPASQRTIGVVEHLLSALGGLGCYTGVSATINGPELPLLGGGAQEFCDALMQLGVAPSLSPLTITRTATVRIDESEYEFRVSAGTRVEVHIDFPVTAIGAQSACWDGLPASFYESVAPARTFGFLQDAERLRARGLARGATPASVIVLDADGAVHPESLPVRRHEYALHKLQDLVGDCYLMGGVPVGTLVATRPGHRRTHQALREAISRGIVALRS